MKIGDHDYEVDRARGVLVAHRRLRDVEREVGFAIAEHWRDGERIGVMSGPNLITDVGHDHRQDVYFGGTAPGTWAIGLKGTGSPAAGDTMSSHAGWSEVEDYDEANRVAFGGAAGATGVWDNSGGVAVFTISATVTVAGIFVVNDNTKGGTTGVLHAATDFSASRDLVDGDDLRVNYTNTVS